MRSSAAMLRFALPSKGTLYEPTLQLLQSCGLRVSRPNLKQYTARIAGLPDTEVLFHRPSDIVAKVVAGDVDIGISGLDLVREEGGDDPNLLVIEPDLGFARADLVLAVPEAWVDVQSWLDVADLAADFAAAGRQLRVATKYRNLVRSFFYERGVYMFTLVDSQGATEGAPGLGYADMIADITETGTALRENRLKVVAGATILRSQACLIGGRRALAGDERKREIVGTVIELVEAQRRARGLAQIIANVPGPDAATVAGCMTTNPHLRGLQGPTIAPVFSSRPDADATNWWSISVVVATDHVLGAVVHLREIGSTGIVVLPVQYAFADRSVSYSRLLQALNQQEET